MTKEEITVGDTKHRITRPESLREACETLGYTLVWEEVRKWILGRYRHRIREGKEISYPDSILPQKYLKVKEELEKQGLRFPRLTKEEQEEVLRLCP